jgi:hypothetical protein
MAQMVTQRGRAILCGGGTAGSVDGSSAFRFGAPEAILEFPYFLGAGRTYDVAPDGRFLVVKPGPVLEPSIPTQVILVEHWFEELKRLVLTN